MLQIDIANELFRPVGRVIPYELPLSELWKPIEERAPVPPPKIVVEPLVRLLTVYCWCSCCCRR